MYIVWKQNTREPEQNMWQRTVNIKFHKPPKKLRLLALALELLVLGFVSQPELVGPLLQGPAGQPW